MKFLSCSYYSRAEIKADEIKLEARHVSSLTLSHLINFALIMHYEVN